MQRKRMTSKLPRALRCERGHENAWRPVERTERRDSRERPALGTRSGQGLGPEQTATYGSGVPAGMGSEWLTRVPSFLPPSREAQENVG
jgi:hypothetical protein